MTSLLWFAAVGKGDYGAKSCDVGREVRGNFQQAVDLLVVSFDIDDAIKNQMYVERFMNVY